MTQQPSDKEQRRIFGIRPIAIVEALGMLIILTLLDVLVFDGNRFWGVNPHPFWIPVH